MTDTTPRTLYEKVWHDHLAATPEREKIDLALELELAGSDWLRAGDRIAAGAVSDLLYAIVDAEASGHIVSQIGAAKVIGDLVHVGLVRDQTQWMLDILENPDSLQVGGERRGGKLVALEPGAAHHRQRLRAGLLRRALRQAVLTVS